MSAACPLYEVTRQLVVEYVHLSQKQKIITKAAKDAACFNAVERLVAPLLLEILLPCVRAGPCSLWPIISLGQCSCGTMSWAGRWRRGPLRPAVYAGSDTRGAFEYVLEGHTGLGEVQRNRTRMQLHMSKIAWIIKL